MESTIPILVSLYHPFPRTLSLSLPSTSPISSLSSLLSSYCPPTSQLLQFSSGRSLPSPSSPLSALNDGQTSTSAPVFLRLSVKLPGGKGGFASQLRAQGGRMSSNKAQNHDSCRGLDGRRLSTIKEAQRLAKLLESEPDRQAAAAKAAEAKLEALNQEIKQLERAAGVESSGGPVASGSGSTEAPTSNGGGTKRRLDDTKYVEESREIVSGVKDAVRAAMMKKRKKAATKPPSPSSDETATPATTSSVSKDKENAVPVAEEQSVDEEAKEAVEESELAGEGKGKGKASGAGGKGKGKAKA
ncbi:uncharacterized protein JCM6883_001337 [Sporobolomyces salmoneus]|uniref:uncharacterized protein n=1 Tax=Sporobolomyces salmoneus TaxID=183962 RepID=UPI00317CEEB7